MESTQEKTGQKTEPKKLASYLFAVAGFIMLLANAIRYLSGDSTQSAFVTIGIALIVMSFAIARKK